MRRVWASLGSTVFFLVAPGTVTGLVPWWLTGWALRPAFFGLEPVRALGVALVVLGLIPLIASFARFAWQGLGTPAPIAAPTQLVVGGFYRHVRNPMYVALQAILIGEGLLFANGAVFLWALMFWLGCHLAVVVYEEPALNRAFGREYETYRAHVPRWIPRLTPWRAAVSEAKPKL